MSAGIPEEVRRLAAERHQRHLLEQQAAPAPAHEGPLPNPWLSRSAHGPEPPPARYDAGGGDGGSGGSGFAWGQGQQPLIRDLGYTQVTVHPEEWQQRPFRTPFLLTCCPCCLGDPCGERHRRDLAAASRTFVAVITAIDIIAFILEIVVTVFTPGASLNGILAPPACVLVECGAVFTPLMVAPRWQLWRLATPMVLHAGPLHIIMNMYVQLLLGIQCETEWGTRKTAAIYVASGVGGALASAVASPTSIGVGASGAIVGLLGARLARLVTEWHTMDERVRNSQAAQTMVNLLLLSSLGAASSAGDIPGVTIDNFAHGGTFSTCHLHCSSRPPHVWPSAVLSRWPACWNI